MRTRVRPDGRSISAEGQGLRGESGQALILMLLLLTFVFVVGAIAIDLGLWFAERRGLQRAADFASLAGSIELPTDPAKARASALEWASRNGYKDGVDGTSVEVDMLCANNLPRPPSGVCANPTGNVSTCFPEVGCDSMRVVIRKPADRLFSTLFGVDSVAVGSGAAAKLSFEVTPLDTVMLLDDTGSMDVGCNGSQTNPGCPIREAKIAANGFTDILLGDQGGLSQVGYAPYRGCYRPPRQNSACSPASSIKDLTDVANDIHGAINQATADGGSGTNVCLPFSKAMEMFDGPNAQTGADTVRFVVILTDGDNTYNAVSFGNGEPPTACRPTTSPNQSDGNLGSDCSSAQTRERQLDTRTKAITDKLKAEYHVEVYVAAFGTCGSDNPNQTATSSYCSGIGDSSHDNTADRRLLKCIASSTPGTNDHYFEVTTASALPEVFNTIAWKIADRALLE